MTRKPALAAATRLPDWKTQLADAVDSVIELLELLGLEQASQPVLTRPGFHLRVPRAYIRKMRPGDPADPLLRQVLPLIDELSEGGMPDPVSDLAAMPEPGLLHKYHGRALLVTTGACAVNCRYCFRRHFPYADANPLGRQREQALHYIENDESIREVILSGGDPLVLDNDKLGGLLNRLEQIEHLRWLRIHTRLPVVLPARIDSGLLALLSQTRLRTSIVIHANHANEITRAEQSALGQLAAGGVTLLNQSVLLKDVNDCAATLITLSERLYESQVLPYYLHMLDPVRGAMHFDVPVSEAVNIIDNMRSSLPGFLVPRLVREHAGEASKTAIFSI